MTEQEYRNHPGVNKSTLWEIRKSPKHYKWLLEHPTEDTQALKMGRLIHMCVLESQKLKESYIVAPDVDKRTKDGKAAWAEFLEQAGDREIITMDEFSEAESISRSVWKDAYKLLEGALAEVVMFWDDPRTGIGCKCRVDAMMELDDRFIMVDLKTCADASTGAFVRDALKYGYHVQAAHYMNGAKANNLNKGKPIEWWFIAVEKKEPYAVNLIRADEGFLDEGQFRLMGLMDRLDECLKTNEWPGYGENVLTLPGWAVGNEEED